MTENLRNDDRYDVTTLQISIMIGRVRKSNRADVTVRHVPHALKCIGVSNSEEEKCERNLRYWQCNWSVRQLIVNSLSLLKKVSINLVKAEVKLGFSWLKLAFSYYWIFLPVKERDAFPIQLHDVLFRGKITKKSTISWTVQRCHGKSAEP